MKLELSRTVKNLKIYLRDNKLTGLRFTDAGRRHETPGSEAKELVTHRTAGNISCILATVFPFSPNPREAREGECWNSPKSTKFSKEMMCYNKGYGSVYTIEVGESWKFSQAFLKRAFNQSYCWFFLSPGVPHAQTSSLALLSSDFTQSYSLSTIYTLTITISIPLSPRESILVSSKAFSAPSVGISHWTPHRWHHPHA